MANEYSNIGGAGGSRRFRGSVRLWLLLILVAAAIIAAVIAIVVITRKNKESGSGSGGEDAKFVYVNCQPETSVPDQKICSQRGCQWQDSPKEHTPQCYFGKGYGYKLNGSIEFKERGSEFRLRRTNTDAKFYGDEVNELRVQVTYFSDRTIRIKIDDSGNPRYEVPIEIAKPEKNADNRDYSIEYIEEPQFGFRITRNSTKSVIFETDIPGMLFSDQFLQISTRLPSENVYGLGERRTDNYRLGLNTNVTMFARDVGTTENSNLYGTHPFYMNVENDGNANGVFFLNSNAMQVLTQTPPSLTFRSIGGILDIFVFVGPTPEDVVQQYQKVIGFPRIPPYWSLGFQLSRWGYNTLEEVRKVEDRNINASIPWDIQTFDIDYMDEHKIFTYDQGGFKELPQFVQELHNKHRKLILIMDPAVASNDTYRNKYPALDEGIKQNVFIKYKNGSILQGEVWPGVTYFPDFSHANASKYWGKLSLDQLVNKGVQFDGMWLDMNEPSSFSCSCENNKLNYPPFTANVRDDAHDGRLFDKTICMDAEQSAGLHYNVHSLYGYFHAKTTYEALSNEVYKGTRPMILARSTYPGSGKYTSHWLGDNDSAWWQMRISIPGMLSFNLFGIPHVGADICGFNGDTNEELCLRWTQLGAFYPFSRNHNTIGTKDQDPAFFGKEVIEGSRQALTTRYRLLPYLYTLFYQANTEGSTVARPLLHEFPADKKTWEINYQFLWGPALLISPVVYENATKVDAYFPSGAIWYDFYTGVPLSKNGDVQLEASTSKVNLHVRGGYILPMQVPNVTTFESRQNPMELYVAPNEKKEASGLLFWDDGESIDSVQNKKYLLLKFDFAENSTKNAVLKISVKHNDYSEANKLNFGEIKIFGQESASNVTVDGREAQQWAHNNETNVIDIQDKLVLTAEHIIEIIRV